MHQVYDQLYEIMLDKAIDQIFHWPFTQTHPLGKCSSEVKEHVQKAGKLAKENRFVEAIEELGKTIEKDRKYVGGRVLSMNFLIENDQPLIGLLVGGGVLMLTEDPEIQGKIWDMAGGIAQSSFENSCQTSDIKQALICANKATNLAPSDVVSAWNRVEILLIYFAHLRAVEKVEEANKLIEMAKAGVESILELGRNRQGNAVQFWPHLLENAEKKLPEGEWWKNRFSEMKQIGKKLTNDLNTTRIVDVAPKSSAHRFDWQSAARCALLLSILVWPSIYGLIQTNEVTPLQDSSKVIETVASSDSDGKLIYARSLINKYDEISRIKRPLEDLA